MPERSETICLSVFSDEELHELITLSVEPGTFARLRRMPLAKDGGQEGDTWLDFYPSEYDLADTIKLSPDHTEWLLGEFFNIPERKWRKKFARLTSNVEGSHAAK